MINEQIYSMKNIGEIIKKTRKKMGLTQKEAAGFSNRGMRFFSELENGKETLEIGKVLSVIRNFGLEVHITKEIK